MLSTFRNQCHFGGIFPYISAVTIFEIHFLSFLGADSSRAGEFKVIISQSILCLFEQAIIIFYVFLPAEFIFWVIFMMKYQFDIEKNKTNVKKGEKLLIFSIECLLRTTLIPLVVIFHLFCVGIQRDMKIGPNFNFFEVYISSIAGVFRKR